MLVLAACRESGPGTRVSDEPLEGATTPSGGIQRPTVSRWIPEGPEFILARETKSKSASFKDVQSLAPAVQLSEVNPERRSLFGEALRSSSDRDAGPRELANFWITDFGSRS